MTRSMRVGGMPAPVHAPPAVALEVDVREELLHDLLGLDGPAVVELGEHLVLGDQRGLDLLPQDRLVEEVLDADADAVHLVGVGRADAAAGGADLALAEEALADLVHRRVVGRDHVGVGADPQAGGVQAARLEAVELLHQHGQVDDDAVADHRRDAGGEDARGQQVQGVLLAVDHHRVAGVVAAVELHDVVDLGAEQVSRLALALVAPLRPDQHDAWHVR